MKLTLYIAKAEDDRLAAYAFTLTNYKEIIDSGVFIALGKRKEDESYCGHVAVQRALRRAVRSHAGPIQLTIVFDAELIDDGIAFELLDVPGKVPLYPTLCRTTRRIMKRFQTCEVASMTEDESDLLPAEATVIDEALDAIYEANTVRGRLKVWRDTLINPQKIIR